MAITSDMKHGMSGRLIQLGSLFQHQTPPNISPVQMKTTQTKIRWYKASGNYS
jgi:hypothetical protein